MSAELGSPAGTVEVEVDGKTGAFKPSEPTRIVELTFEDHVGIISGLKAIRDGRASARASASKALQDADKKLLAAVQEATEFYHRSRQQGLPLDEAAAQRIKDAADEAGATSDDDDEEEENAE